MADFRATPEKYPTLGALSRVARSIDQFARKPFGYANPPVQALSDLLGIPSIYNTAENIAYGSPLTSGSGQARRINPEVSEAMLASTNFAPAVGPTARLVGKTARASAPYAARQAVNLAEKYGVAPTMNVMKQKGGNWLEGSVEKRLQPLRKAPVLLDKYEIREAMSPEDLGKYFAASNVEGVTDLPSQLKAAGLYDKYVQPDPVNNWIDKQLTRYVRNEMATPEDPLRALAERGVMHYEPGYYGLSEDLGRTRVAQGYPEKGLAESDLAKLWETQADMSIEPFKAGDIQAGLKLNIPVRGARGGEEWINKLDPEANIYGLDFLDDELGFKHLIDEMRNATNPESGLPRELLLKYGSLPQVSVPQAVERVAKINEWRAAQKAAADAAKANNAATFTHKEYPEQGFKWVELKQPPKPEDWSSPDRYSIVHPTPSAETLAIKDNETGKYIATGLESEDQAVKHLYDTITKKHLEDALKYEGETMGHCVGGYCPDVSEGRSRIFSLRNEKGEPHVTIETKPKTREEFINENYKDYQEMLLEGKDFANRWVDQQLKNAPSSIAQIKGKANRAPKEDYLPFVQDFVRSGKWSDVGDLGNAGLRKIDPLSDLGVRIKEAGVEVSPYVTESELTDLLDRHGRTSLPSSPEGYAKGGIVEYDPDKVDSIVQGLRNYEPSEGLAPHGLRHAGDSAKGKGYFGLLPHASGMATEISSEDIEGEYPLIVPTLTREELDHLLSGERPTDEIYNKAELHATKRRQVGKPTFAQPDELHYPVPEKFAQGGAVEYNPAKIEMLAQKLREELHG